MKRTLCTTVLVSLALLLAACGPTPTPETVIVKETVVVTRDVVVTVTPEPPTPTPEPRVFFQDDFEVDDPKWSSLGVTADTEWFYGDGQMRGLVKTPYLATWVSHPELQAVDDFSLEIDVTQISGPDNNDFGIMFRVQNPDNWYAFLISGDGYFKILGNSEGQPYDITRWVQADAIRKGQSTNHLQLIAKGPQISAFVNGELLTVVRDNTFRRGDIWLRIGTFDEPRVYITFDNLVVVELD